MESSSPAPQVSGRRLFVEGLLVGAISFVIYAVPPHVPWIVLGPVVAGAVGGVRTKANAATAFRLCLFIAAFICLLSLIIIGIVGFVAATIPRASLRQTPFADFDFGFALLLTLLVSIYAFCLGFIGAYFGGKFASRKVK